MMRELLRVTMSAKQIREACEGWARERSSLNGANFDVAVKLSADAAEVVFMQKRIRKASKPTEGK